MRAEVLQGVDHFNRWCCTAAKTAAASPIPLSRERRRHFASLDKVSHLPRWEMNFIMIQKERHIRVYHPVKRGSRETKFCIQNFRLTNKE